MLKGISPHIGPELLSLLYSMGHGDDIVLADAHYPGESMNTNVIRKDGMLIPQLLEAILPIFELDTYIDHPTIMMAAVTGDRLDPKVEKSYTKVIQKYSKNIKAPLRVDRFDFYDRSKNAFGIVMSGDTHKYGNIILKKGVTPI